MTALGLGTKPARAVGAPGVAPLARTGMGLILKPHEVSPVSGQFLVGDGGDSIAQEQNDGKCAVVNAVAIGTNSLP
jgi:hypothetical protein